MVKNTVQYFEVQRLLCVVPVMVGTWALVVVGEVDWSKILFSH
jgi:hypothetical protein